MKDEVLNVADCPDGSTLYTLKRKDGEVYTVDHIDNDYLCLVRYKNGETAWKYASEIKPVSEVDNER